MDLSELPSDPPKQPLNTCVHKGFDYTTLDPQTRIIVQHNTIEIKKRLPNTISIWETGQRLVEVKRCLEYGLFLSWLKSEFDWSQRTAYNYLSVYESFDLGNIAGLDISVVALYLLAADSTPIAARTEATERARAGEKITRAKALAIIKQYKAASKSKKLKRVATIDVVAETVRSEPYPVDYYKNNGSVSTATPQTNKPGNVLERELSEKAKQLGLLLSANQNFPSARPTTKPGLPTASKVEEICNQFVQYLNEMDHQSVTIALKALSQRANSEVLDLMCDSELKNYINYSQQLIKRAKWLLNQRWQLQEPQ